MGPSRHARRRLQRPDSVLRPGRHRLGCADADRARPGVRGGSRRATVATLVALNLTGAPAAAASVPPALLAAARLQGYWTVSGVVTKSVNVPDERPGALVTRTWAFVPSCPTGACPTLMLVRQRGPGYDNVPLQSTGPGVYVGTGSFYAPAQCRGKVF